MSSSLFSRPQLAQLRAYAIARGASPEAVLGLVLARTLATIPPTVTGTAILGRPLSLNIAVATDDELAPKVAAELMPLAPHVREVEATGSLVPAIRGCDQALVTLRGMDARILISELATALTGGEIGSNSIRTTAIEPHSYRAVAILTDAAAEGIHELREPFGITERILHLPTNAEGGTVQSELPARPIFVLPEALTSGDPFEIAFPAEVVAEIFATFEAAMFWGSEDSGIGHRDLLKLKVAVAFAALDERVDVTVEDWELATELVTLTAAKAA